MRKVLSWPDCLCQLLIDLPSIEMLESLCTMWAVNKWLLHRRQKTLHRCVTEFMRNTCRCTKTNDRDFSCKLNNNLMVDLLCRLNNNLMVDFDDMFEAFPSGSSAEFYIKPMLTCVGDTDTMTCRKDSLAIPTGHSPPTELPDHFKQFITVHEIVDSYQSGYVYLKPSYNLVKKEEGHYAVEKVKRSGNAPEYLRKPDNEAGANVSTEQVIQIFLQHYLKQDIQNRSVQSTLNSLYSTAAQAHGPALAYTDHAQLPASYTTRRHVAAVRSYKALSNFDVVSCVRCLLWPPQAVAWPLRLREHGWPNEATISMVVSNGCDVVGAVHPRCRQDEWINEHQWRLSFSRAEVTLINNWTPLQQIIYHMLRFVLKREVLSKIDDKEQGMPKLSNYHIKTLMLWECEQKPQSWWSAEPSVIKLCSSLLYKLCEWVEDKRCQHYFINDCNIIDHCQDASSKLCYDLRSLADPLVLSTWFFRNYILLCAQCCPAEVSELFENISSAYKLERAVQAVVDRKLTILPNELYLEQFWFEWEILDDLQMLPIDANWLKSRKRKLQKFDPQLRDYITAALSLQIAYTATIYSLTEDHLEMLWVIFDPFNSVTTSSGELLSIEKAIKLATLRNVRSNTLEMLYIEMSKAYLHHSLAYGQESTYCRVHVLLAALYYMSGYYQIAIDHCKQVLNQCDSDQYGLQRIGAAYLPQIDDSVDNVFGLVLLYDHVRRNALYSDKKVESEKESVPAFTAQVLACYLYFKCSTVETTTENKVNMLRQLMSNNEPLLLSDVLLFRATVLQLSECSETPVAENRSGNNAVPSTDATLLVTTLEQVALEKLIAVRQVMIREMLCEKFTVVNEFEVLYAYKRGLFAECAELCRRNIDIFFAAGSLTIQAYCVAFPEMLSLLDGELVSVFGIIQLLSHNMSFQFTGVFELPKNFRINISTLLLYLLVRCLINLQSDSLDDTMKLIRCVDNALFSIDKEVFFLDRLILGLTSRSLQLHTEALTSQLC